MKLPTRFMLFAMVGGFSACVNFGARLAFSQFVSYELAIVAAFPVALTTAFLLNRLFVFRHDYRHSWRGQYLRFLTVNLLALVQVFIVSVGLARWLFPLVGMAFYPESVAHAVGLLSPIVTSYWLHKHFSFAAETVSSRDPALNRADDVETGLHARTHG